MSRFHLSPQKSIQLNLFKKVFLSPFPMKRMVHFQRIRKPLEIHCPKIASFIF
ncbi:MAG: DUF723 domain-containing protein [Simkania negevensis]|nr:DUF723 domain-containing protein [Simkania negevensis]